MEQRTINQYVVNYLSSKGGGLIEVLVGTMLLKSGIKCKSIYERCGYWENIFKVDGVLFDTIFNFGGGVLQMVLVQHF